jgi:hypothetical protein
MERAKGSGWSKGAAATAEALTGSADQLAIPTMESAVLHIWHSGLASLGVDALCSWIIPAWGTSWKTSGP